MTKKTSFIALILILLLSTLTIFLAVFFLQDNNKYKKPLINMSLENNYISLNKDENFDIDYSILNPIKGVEISYTYDQTIVKVEHDESKIKISALSPGETTLTINYEKAVSKQIKIDVKELPSIEIDNNDLIMHPNENKELTYNIPNSIENAEISYTYDQTIVKVEHDESKIKISALSPGETTLTINYEKAVSKQIKIDVKELPSIEIDNNDLIMHPNENKELTYNIPNSIENAEISYTYDQTIVKVEHDESKIKISALSPGETTLTINYEKAVSKQIKIDVKELPSIEIDNNDLIMHPNENKELTYNIPNSIENAEISYTYDQTIVKVEHDESKIKISALSPGETTLTINYEKAVSKQIKIDVKELPSIILEGEENISTFKNNTIERKIDIKNSIIGENLNVKVSNNEIANAEIKNNTEERNSWRLSIQALTLGNTEVEISYGKYASKIITFLVSERKEEKIDVVDPTTGNKLSDQKYISDMVVNKEDNIIYSFGKIEDSQASNTKGTYLYNTKENKIEKISDISFAFLSIDNNDNIYGSIVLSSDENTMGLWKLYKDSDQKYVTEQIKATKNHRIYGAASITKDTNNVYFSINNYDNSNLVSENGLYRLNKDNSITRLVANSIRTILAISDNEIYYGHYAGVNSGLFLYTSNNNREKLSDITTLAICKINNSIYFGYNKGLFELNLETKKTETISNRYYRKLITDGTYLYGGFHDNTENDTENIGVWIYDVNNIKANPNRIIKTSILSLVLTKDNDLYVGNQGIYKYSSNY
ncbi:hypothetical protein [Mesoplasma florum]|uniref:hypothetical protein n=1 Tax=Mesoplasma florum TaxID=2151 RepID=UPI000BE47947|nr:hypothetical protein [Mesoplasma florum]ATI74087.1 hypothetical protein CQZ70_02405 [Mesoplasma florum]